MTRRLPGLPILFAAVLAPLALLPAPPASARWATADNGFYQADLVCRDGMLATYIPFDQSGAAADTAVSAYHNTSGTPFDRDSTLPAADYGPTLTPPLTFTASLQPAPLQADTSDDGSIGAGETYTVYARMVLRWSPELAVGAEAVLAYRQSFEGFARGFAAGPVEDCRFQTGSRSVTVSSAQVSAGPALLPADALTFQVARAPAAGSLRRGDIPLPPGRGFTAAEVAAGQLQYSYEEPYTRAGFQYRVVGTAVGGLTAAGARPRGYSWAPALAADGRYLGFNSSASDVVDGDTNGQTDVFVRDLQAGTTSRVSISFDGTPETGRSFNPALSSDGRYVAFTSEAANLVRGDTNGLADVFVRDMQARTTSRISVSFNGASETGSSSDPAISADGRYIAFTSGANNLVGNDSNGWNDVFVRDMQTGQTTRVSLHSNGAQATGGNSSSAAIAADGRYVAFTSAARNLVDDDTNTCPTFPAAGACPDIFVHDRQTGETTRVSVGPGGAQANGASYSPAISADGRYVAFRSSASNLVDGDTNTCPTFLAAGACPDIFVHDRQTGETTRVSVGPGGAQANRDSYSPAISADGRYVAFQSSASNLVSGDTNTCQGSPVGACPDIFIHDRQTGLTTRASVSSAGAEANNSSGTLAMAANGAYIAFESTATNLVSGADTNDNADIFVRYMSAPRDVELVSQPTIYLPLVRRP